MSSDPPLGAAMVFYDWADKWPKDNFGQGSAPPNDYLFPHGGQVIQADAAKSDITDLGLARIDPAESNHALLWNRITGAYDGLDERARESAYWHGRSGRWFKIAARTGTGPGPGTPPSGDRRGRILDLISRVNAMSDDLGEDTRREIVDALERLI